MKIKITMLALAAFLKMDAQHFFGAAAEVGSSYRLLKTDYIAAEYFFNEAEAPHFSAGIHATYKYEWGKRWFVQSGVEANRLAYRTQFSEGQPDELIFEVVSSNHPDNSVGKETFFGRIGIPLVLNFVCKEQGAWRIVAGAGARYELSTDAYIKFYDDNGQTHRTPLDVNDNNLGLLFQFGWINRLKNRDQLSFTFRFAQDVKPIKNGVVHRQLNSLTFQLGYWFSV